MIRQRQQDSRRLCYCLAECREKPYPGAIPISGSTAGRQCGLGVFGKYVDPKKFKLSPASFVRTGMDKKLIQQLTEYGQNLTSGGVNEIAIAHVIALVITELQQ
ncbi:hypothetical protein, partial [Algoriphagus antarcticus]|uniref:hypothetical protein n=1 Tax=Algoriphagus antarcticus TaxID=238540 RepID=UPI0011246AE9